MIQRQPAIPQHFSVANGASFVFLQVAPGSLASIFAFTRVSQNFAASSLPLPKTLGGVRVQVGGALQFDDKSLRWSYSPVGSADAGLLFVGPNQINFQMPPGISPGDMVGAQLLLTDGSSLLTTLRVSEAAPGIFTVLMSGQGQAAALNQDNSVNFGTRPALRGSVIQIFATGAGATNPPLGAGEPAPISGNPLLLTVAQPTVTIGGKTARVLFSGLAPGFVGLWQINAEVPQDVTPGAAVPLQVSVGSSASNTVTIGVQ